MSKQPSIVILLDLSQRWSFFRRFAASLRSMGYNVVFITYKFSLYLLAKSAGEIIYCSLRKNLKKHRPLDYASDVLSEKVKLDNAIILYNNIMSLLDNVNKKFNFKYALIWSGSDTAELAISHWAAQNNIDRVFFEIANMPGKLFIDPHGVNAQSFLYSHPEFLDDLEDDVSGYNQWRENYINQKLNNAYVPQTKNIKKVTLWPMLDRFLSFMHVAPPYEDIPFIEKVRTLFLIKNRNFKYDSIDLQNEEYVFFPLQVSSDVQILINSNIDIHQGILKALEIAKENRMKLIIKPHPAEPDVAFVKQIESLKNMYHFYFSNENIFELMQNAKIVVTINSTAGLEAKILGCDVKVLSKAIYQDFDETRLRKYIMKHLIDIDYFEADDPIEPHIIEHIFKYIDQVSRVAGTIQS